MDMSDLIFDAMPEAPEEVGIQNDGEPVAVEPAPVEETPAPEAEETEETSEEVAERKKKTGSQRAKEKAQRLAEENEMLRRLLLDREPKKEPQAAPADPSKPKLEDFDTHSEWVEAVTDWKVEKKLRDREEKTKQEQFNQAWIEQAKEAKKEFEDFDEALESAPAPSPEVSAVLAESPLKAHLAYYLATHEDDYARINKMKSPVAVGRELGLIEARLTKKATTDAPNKAPSKAPKPPTPVAAAVSAKPDGDGRLAFY